MQKLAYALGKLAAQTKEAALPGAGPAKIQPIGDTTPASVTPPPAAPRPIGGPFFRKFLNRRAPALAAQLVRQ